MLDEVPMDGVVISSPHVLHFEHAKAALEKGCHVLVEKPLTTSAADARALVALAQRGGQQIVVPYGWNFRPFAAEARRLAGGVGKIEHVVLQMANALDDLFAGEPMKETEGAMFRPPASTWADPKRAGGFGWGQLVHALGLMFRVADLEPAEVFAMTGASPAGVDYYDAAAVRFAGGATGSVRRGDAAQGPPGADRPPHLRLRGHAPPRHRARAGRASPPRRPGRGDRAEAPATAPMTASRRSASSSTSAAASRRATRPGIVGVRAVEVLDAMYRSAASGRMEKV